MITEIEFKQFIKTFLDNNVGKINIDTLDDFLDNYDFTDTFHNCNINKIKGDIFEYIVKYYYLSHNYETYLFKDIPVLLRDKLGLGNVDNGIDLIYKDGELWYGVQCKWRKTPKFCIHKDLISGFLAEFNREDVKLDYAVLFTNVTNINSYHRNSNLTWKLRKDLKLIDNKFINFILNDEKIVEVTEQPITQLRYYQNEAIDNLIKSKDKCKQIIMACGTGKSIVIVEYIKLIKSSNKNKIVILLPSLQLISQFYKKLSEIMPKENILSICSQMDISTFTNDVTNKALINDRLKDLENGSNLRFTTNKSVIDNKLKLKKLIVLCTYQSSSLLKDQIFDLGIFDEAHKTVNGEMFGFALYDTNVKINERVFFTATPKYYIGNGEKCMSMDNKEIYGNVQYEYSFKKAIEEKNILDFEVVTYTVPKNMADIVTEKYIKKDGLNVKSEVLISALLLIQHIRENKSSNKILTYHNSIKNALEFKKTLNYVMDIFKINADVYTLSGKARISLRNKIFSEFEKDENKISIICSAKVLNEGVDLPCINTVMFVDPRSSTIDVTQCIGRGIRLYNNQTKCSIIIPIHYDQIEMANNYAEIIRILTAMVEIDGQIIENFVTKNANNKIIVKNVNLPEVIINEAIDVKYSLSDLEKNLGIVILNSQLLGFEYKKTLLFEYSTINSEAPIQDTMYKDYNIGNFLLAKKGQINNVDDVLYEQLAENNFVKISIDEYLIKRETKLTWGQWKEILIAFYEIFKRHPYQNEEYDGKTIGSWYHKQKGRISSNTDKLYNKLAINDVIKQNIDDYISYIEKKKEKNIKNLTWEEWRILLFEFCNLPNSILMSKTVYKSYNIGNWLSHQKDAIHNTDDKFYVELSKNPIIKETLDEYLKSLAKKDGIPKLSWNEFKNLLFKFCDIEKRVPERLEEYEQQKIGSWYGRQKKQIKCETDSKYVILSENIYVKENLEYHIDPNKSWNESCQKLFSFCNKYHICPILSLCDDDDDKFIFNWFGDQKKKIKSPTDELYLKLSKNEYVKINLDKFLEKKIKN